MHIVHYLFVIMNLTVSPKQSKKLPQGIIAWVVYGKTVPQAYSIQFDKNSFIKLYRQCGSSTPFDLVGEGIKQMVLVQDIQKDNVSNVVYHVDFLALNKDQKVQTHVPLKFIGESLVEKSSLGRIQYLKDSLLIEALPADLPRELEVDITSIQTLNDSVFVSDIKVSDKIIIKEDKDLPVVVAVEISEEKEETPTATTTTEATTDTPAK